MFAVCRGTSNGLTHSDNTAKRYNTYKSTYTNCTYVDGNLELIYLTEQENYDLSFLQDIREITGYVLIFTIFTDYIPLTNLRIIRGQTLWEGKNGKRYSLAVFLNFKEASNVGLKELRFTSLHGK